MSPRRYRVTMGLLLGVALLCAVPFLVAQTSFQVNLRTLVDCVGGLKAVTWTASTGNFSCNTATAVDTASTIVGRDANKNTKVNNIEEEVATTATAAGTTTLAVTSAPWQQFTGTTTQTVTLPNATTLNTGHRFWVMNRSTGAVTVKDNGANTLATLGGNSESKLVLMANGTSNGTWDVGTTYGSGGSTITLPEHKWFAAGVCDDTTPSSAFDNPSANAPVETCYGTSPHRFVGLDFANSGTLTTQFHMILPDDWTSTGGIDAKVTWSSASSSTNNVRFTVATWCIGYGTGGLPNPSFSSATGVTVANASSVNVLNHTVFTAVDLTSCAAPSLMFFRFSRDNTVGSNLAATVFLIGVDIVIRRTITKGG